MSRVEDELRKMATTTMLADLQKEIEKTLQTEYLPLLDINDKFDERDF